jgi:Glycosyl hydrolase family 12
MHAMRHSIAAAIAVAALSGTAALSGCAAATSGPGAPGTTGAASSAAGAGADGQAVTFAPVLASMPPSATTKPAATGKPATAPTASASAGQHATGAGSSSSGTGSGSGGSGAGSGSATGSGNCQHPVFTTSDQQGGETLDGYYITNDMWNVGNYSVSQTLYACSAANWYVTATMNNNSGDGAVKTYPNVHLDLSSGPAISSFHSITSSFAQGTNPGGIYEYAYDIWINGLATSNSTEVMIWTSNHGQAPSGSQVGTTTVGGQGFAVWKSGSYIAFVADQNVDSGSLNLLQFFDYIIGKGWLASSATLNQVDYGVELVSTNSSPETFSFTNFSVSTS